MAPAMLAVIALTRPALGAGGAFAVDDAEVGSPGSCKVESWASFANNSARDFIGVVSPACVVSLGRPVEITVPYQRARGDETWGTTLTLKGKTSLAPVETGKLGLGLVGGTTWDLISKENTGGFASIPATFQVVENFKINLNAGWLYDRPNELHWLTWGASFEWNFIKPMTLIAEVFGQSGHTLDPPSVAQPCVQAGLRVTPAEAFDVDFIYGHNITGEKIGRAHV